MKALKQNGNMILLCLLEVIIGVLLLINPVGFTTVIIIAAGVALMIGGLLNVIQYFRCDPKEAAIGQLLMKGLVSLLAGCFCSFNSHWFIVTFPIIAILYGVVVLVAGLSKIQMSVDMLRLKSKKWWWSAISAVISIVCAVVIIGNPFASTVALWYFTGISLIVEAIFDVVTLIVSGRNTET